MSKYTPGPWKTTKRKRFQVHKTVALCARQPWYAVYSIGPCHSNEWEANARLIAAAPDLLEALRRILEHCDINPEGETTFERDVQAGRAAVSKATLTTPEPAAQREPERDEGGSR